MMKECFGLSKVDAQKFRECAECPIFEQCTRVGYLGEARIADRLAFWLGLVLGALGLVLAFALRERTPNGAIWLAGISLVYAACVRSASREYAARNADESRAARDGAESAPAPAHGHP